MAKAFLSVGSNIDPAENVRRALELLGGHADIMGISTVYLTAAENRPEQPSYYNCVIEVETQAPPLEFKYSVLRTIEEAIGRRRTEDKSAARTIDLDLILYDDLIMETETLTIPDPQISRRAFVALPLHELSPDLRLPGSGVSIAEIAASLPQGEMTPLKQYTEILRKEICQHERREG
jgi:dihydroneopterin aldolase/2-amino-4-hydroxy-6-hydroxymethyldihydropteridine diphosphokinase